MLHTETSTVTNIILLMMAAFEDKLWTLAIAISFVFIFRTFRETDLVAFFRGRINMNFIEVTLKYNDSDNVFSS